MVLVFAGHWWLAEHLMLINSFILSMNPVRKVDVEGHFLPSKGCEFEAELHRLNKRIPAHSWDVTCHFEVCETNIFLADDSFFSFSNFKMAPYSHQAEVLIGQI